MASAGFALSFQTAGAAPQRFELITTAPRPSVTAAGGSYAPQFSADGRRLFFLSNAGNLAANDDRRATLDLFVHDLATGQNRLASKTADGQGGSEADILY